MMNLKTSQRDDLTSVSLGYSKDSPVEQKCTLLLRCLGYSRTDACFSGFSEQYSLHLKHHNPTPCRYTIAHNPTDLHPGLILILVISLLCKITLLVRMS